MYTYVLWCRELDVYKIGHTKNIKSRVGLLGIQLPFAVELLCYFPSDSDEYIQRTEKALHKFFAASRLNGEWFRLSPDDLDYIYDLSQVSYDGWHINEQCVN